MPSYLVSNLSGGDLLYSGDLYSGYGAPYGGVIVTADKKNSGNIYVSLSGGMTIQSGGVWLSGRAGVMDGIAIPPGTSYWIPKTGIVKTSGTLNIYVASDAACSGQAVAYYELYGAATLYPVPVPGPAIPAALAMSGRMGLNLTGMAYYSTPWETADLAYTRLPARPEMLQSPTSFSRTSGQPMPLQKSGWPYPDNTLNGNVISVAAQSIDALSGVLTTFTATKIAGTDWIFPFSFGGSIERNYNSGALIDNRDANTWVNTSGTILASNLIVSGRDTGYPAGLTPGQQIGGQAGTSRRLPAGNYTFMAKGTGTLVTAFRFNSNTTSGNRNILFTSGVAASGLIVIPVNLQYAAGNGANIETLNTGASNPADPLYDVVITFDRSGTNDNYAAQYAANMDNPYYWDAHQLYKNDLGRMTAGVRFMDMFGTNSSPYKSWADRPQAGRKLGLPYGSRIPFEVACQMLNQYHLRGWVNVPHLADSGYVSQMAQFFYNNCNQDIDVEFSNECWNTLFNQATHMQLEGVTYYHIGSLSSLSHDGNTPGTCTAILRNATTTTNGILSGTSTLQICNATDSNYNGAFLVTSTSGNAFTYTPTTKPTLTTATPYPYTYLMSFDVTSPQTFLVNNITWDVGSASTVYSITTSGTHTYSGSDIVMLCNATDPGFNIISKVNIFSGLAGTLNVSTQNIGGGRLVPSASGGTTTISSGIYNVSGAPVAGQTMRIYRIGSNNAQSGMQNTTTVQYKYYAKRSADVHKTWLGVYSGKPSQIHTVLSFQSANAGGANSKVTYDEWFLNMSGIDLSKVDCQWSHAPYFGTSGSEDTVIPGTIKVPTNLTNVGTTVTVTLNSHGFSNGDSIQIANITDDNFNGIWSITVVDVNTFTYVANVAPSGANTALYSTLGRVAIKSSLYVRELLSASLAGSIVTCVSNNHGLSNGEPVVLCNHQFLDYQIVTPITVVDANTFTYQITSVFNPTANSGKGRMWVMRYSAVTKVLADLETHLTGTVLGWISGHASFAAARGMTVACYEGGTSLQNNNTSLPGTGEACMQANRDPYIMYLINKYCQYLRDNNTSRLLWFNHITTWGPGGMWGLKEYQIQETSPKWLALSGRIKGI
jgi:hypothetical protein